MRARLLRPATGLALLSAAVLALSASAATPAPLTLTDAKGDGNGVNDAGTGLGLEGAPGPGSRAGVDVVSLTLANTVVGRGSKATCNGFTATLELSGPPEASNTLYRVQGTGALNSGRFWLRHLNNPVDGTRTTLQYESDAVTTMPIAPAKIDGNKIIFTVTAKDIKATGEKAGFTYNAPSVDIRASSGAVFAPVWDQLLNEEKSFKTC